MRGGAYHGMVLVVALLQKVLVIVAPLVATCILAGEGLASQEKAGVADLLLLNVDGTRETWAAPSLEVDNTAFSLSVSILSGAGTSLAPTRSPCSWSSLGKVVVVPNGHSEGIMQARVVNRSSSTSDNPTSVSKGRSALWRAKAKVIKWKLATIPAAEAMKRDSLHGCAETFINGCGHLIHEPINGRVGQCLQLVQCLFPQLLKGLEGTLLALHIGHFHLFHLVGHLVGFGSKVSHHTVPCPGDADRSSDQPSNPKEPVSLVPSGHKCPQVGILT